MAIRGVLFDWSGTLIRDDGVALQSPAAAVAAYARDRLGLAVPADAFERAFQAALPDNRRGETVAVPTIDALIGAAYAWLGCSVAAPDIDRCSHLFFEAASSQQVVFDDARALLPSLKYRGYATGVVTNQVYPAHFIAQKARDLGLAGYIDTFVSSADVGVAKPHPGIFERALSDLGLEPFEALFIGDSMETDVAGARAAGMRALYLQRRARAHEAGGYLVIERLSAVNDILGDSMVA